MTPTSPTILPSSLEGDENIIDSTGVSVDYDHLIEELNGFFDTNPFARKIIKISVRKVEKLQKKLRYSSIRLKKVEYYHALAFVTVMAESVIHTGMCSVVGEAIGNSLKCAFPKERYANNAKIGMISPHGLIKPDAQFHPDARRGRFLYPTVVVEVGASESKIELLHDVSDWFTIQEGTIAIEAAVVVKLKLDSRDEVGGPGLLNKIFTGAIFEIYLRVVREDATRDGRQEGWRELVPRETMESTVVLDDHIALDDYPTGIKFSVLVNRGGHHQSITVPAHLVMPDAENDEDVVLLNEHDILQITEDVFWAHEAGVTRDRRYGAKLLDEENVQ